MKVFYGILAALALFSACKPKTPGQQEAANDSAAINTASQPGIAATFYKRLKGTLAGQPVTMHLIRTGPASFDAWYAYDKQGIPIQLLQQTDDTTGLSFSEFTTPDASCTFSGSLSPDGAYKGSWSGNGKTYDFDLKTDNTGALLFDVYAGTDSVLLLPANPKSPMGMATATLVWPSGGADEAALRAVKKALTPAGLSETPEKLVRQSIDTFLRDYKAVRDDVDTNDLKTGGGMSWNWDAQSETRIVWNTFPLVVFEFFNYSFTGGAHGNYGSNFTTVDLAQGKILTLADVLKPGHKPALSAALEKSFRKKYNVPPGEPLDKQWLFGPHIAPNDNFYITGQGIVFTYTPYEIAAYALGQISLFVPFGDISNFVNGAYLK